MIVLLAGVAWADMWCAAPLVVHEWGVHEIHTDGTTVSPTVVPSWFHTDTTPAPAVVPVRQLPPDRGIRRLPVVQFYGSPAPVALEVGFGDGQASVWWPAVDRRISADDANSAAARLGREQLLAGRAARIPMGRNPSLGPDPTKQLGWDSLSLTTAAAGPLGPSEVPWVDALRAVPEALWVGRGPEADRFLFYEADTHGPPAVTFGPGPVVHNVSAHPVHDLVVIANGKAWTTSSLAAGAEQRATFAPLDRDAVVAWLRDRWTAVPAPPRTDCVTMRDPAIPVERATDHRMTGPELDVLLDVWADQLLAPAGQRWMYREDPAALDARMPLAVYTDMFHYVELSRLGIVLVEG